MRENYCEIKKEKVCLLKEYQEWERDDCLYCILLQMDNEVEKLIDLNEKALMPGGMWEVASKLKENYRELYRTLIDELKIGEEIKKFEEKVEIVLERKKSSLQNNEAEGYV